MAHRDWARFGLLFLRDGVWVDGARVLPEGWVEYSTTGSQADAGYGAHWRLGAGIEPSLYFATGFRNENVYVFPNLGLVITRHAMPHHAAPGLHGMAPVANQYPQRNLSFLKCNAS